MTILGACVRTRAAAIPKTGGPGGPGGHLHARPVLHEGGKASESLKGKGGGGAKGLGR